MTNTVAETLRRCAGEFGGRNALTLGGETWSFRDLEESVHSTAIALAGMVPSDGDMPLAVVVRPEVASIAALLAASWLGKPVLVVDDPVRIDAPGGRPISLCGRVDVSRTSSTDIESRELLQRGRALRAQGATAPPRADAAILMSTSGTTGMTKTAVQPIVNLAIGADIYRELFDVEVGDVIVAVVPLAHSFGMVGGLWLALRSGASLVHAAAVPPLAFVEFLAAVKPRVVLGAPLAYDLCVRCAAERPPDLSGVGVMLSSGSMLPVHTSERFECLFRKGVVSLYGSTETGIIAAARSSAEATPGRVGTPAPGVQVRFRGNDGAIVPVGPALLEVQTRTMFAGYLQDGAATGRVLVDGWYSTGDLASSGDDGSLILYGRRTAFVNVGGRKVNPHEVAAVLATHPMVLGARVYGRDAGAAGQHLLAEVILDERFESLQLAEWCRGQLPAYMIPVEFIRVREILSPAKKLSGT